MDDTKYGELVKDLKREIEINVRYGGDIYFPIKLRIEQLNEDDLLEVLRTIAAKFIEKEIEDSI